MSQRRVEDLILELASTIGKEAFLEACLDLLAGADRCGYVVELRSLTGHSWNPGDTVFDAKRWPDYWVRSWGARGLLHFWDERATDAILAGLRDEHWRPAEMCLKVVACHDVAAAADEAILLLTHTLPRVRIQALRALAVVGDTDHFESVAALQMDGRMDLRQQKETTLRAMRLRLDLTHRFRGCQD